MLGICNTFCTIFYIITNCFPLSVPSAPPERVYVSNRTSTSLEITWGPLSSSADENGIIIGYVVEYGSVYSATISTEEPGSVAELAPLEEYTEYSVRVAGFTSVGAGPFSSPVFATTDEDG